MSAVPCYTAGMQGDPGDEHAAAAVIDAERDVSVYEAPRARLEAEIAPARSSGNWFWCVSAFGHRIDWGYCASADRAEEALAQALKRLGAGRRVG